MSIFDAIKKSVLEGFSAQMTLADIIISLGSAFLAGLFILAIYRLTRTGVSRNRQIESTLLLVTPISAMIVLTITSNLALSLGMVGALSIVRFRTAVKDASDTAFMFWSVASGITAGAHFYKITLIGCIFIGLVAFLVLKLTSVGARPYLLVIRMKPGAKTDKAEKHLGEKRIPFRLSSVVSCDAYVEAIYEVAVSRSGDDLVGAITALPETVSVSLVDCK